jgi:hypothetical protein
MIASSWWVIELKQQGCAELYNAQPFMDIFSQLMASRVVFTEIYYLFSVICLTLLREKL